MMYLPALNAASSLLLIKNIEADQEVTRTLHHCSAVRPHAEPREVPMSLATPSFLIIGDG